ncbi:hypothetical protein HUK65_03595 [Rhodobacteraceae bacterium 2376]|uniref:AttH domain-containing protein n=1 Tax=Rhabdonatronobacter sediminivivens TaxID=2743469 RepID=A0A7Z0KWZ9_9RHOB|nr:lipocalin-like domain-containing protein [Rhabdonatronobacter sediminivivens]NYS24064.1 hypothetical protein [Rhabdonatronobacter sediminivivens]
MRTAVGLGVLGLGAVALAFWGLMSAPPSDAPAPDPMAGLLAQEAPGRPGLAPGWSLDLPADHGAHPDAPSELWHLSAHLEGPDGVPLGVQFNLARLALAAPADPGATPDWMARDLFRGHVILADPARGVMAEERLARAMAGVAGADGDGLRLDGWSLRFAPEAWVLEAGTGDTQIALTLTPARPALAADAEGAPFHGYAFTRMTAQGHLRNGGAELPVRGTAWFEHAWGALPIPGGGAAVVSDRLQLQLDDGTDLSLVRSRRADGGGRATLEGFAIDAAGDVRAIDPETAQVAVTQHWDGAGRRWPVGWSVTLDGLALEVTPVIDAQAHDFMAPLWSGLVRAEGRRDGQPVQGHATLTLDAEGLE